MKKIAITIGDPAGIGPEVVLRSIINPEIRKICQPIVVGDRVVIEEAMQMLSMDIQINELNKSVYKNSESVVNLLNRNALASFVTRKPTDANGRACVSYIRKAVDLAINKSVDALVTAPISKESLNMAGFKWHGHTEMLAEFTSTKEYAMMLTGGSLRVMLVTIHEALRNVPDLITKEKVLNTILLAQKACAMLGIENPRIGIAGINPHAGEAGMFGDEEKNKIAPAIEEAKKLDIKADGPYPPDTIFHKAYKGEFDIVVCMYHDQGLIPLKMIAFDSGVNVTVGLPIIRTSPDHGTAYDIAWKGIANPSSMIEAIKLAARLKI